MSILKYTSAFILFISCWAIAKGQNKQELIKNIRMGYQIINGDKNLTKRTLEAEDFLDYYPDGGAELTGYFRKGNLVKITEWYGLSYGNRITEYYLKEGKIFFIYERFMSFVTTDTSMDYTKVKLAFEGRYYINNDKLIHKITSGEIPFKDDSTDNFNDLLLTAKNDIEFLMKKK